MSAYAGPNVSSENLIFCLDPGNKKCYSGSGASAKDLSPNKMAINLIGSPTYSSDKGGYFTLNGTSQYMTFTWPVVTSTWSMSFWLNIGTLSGTVEKEIFATPGDSFILLIGLQSGVWKYIFWNGSVSLLTNNVDAVVTGVWQNITVTCASSTGLIVWYLNGKKFLDHGFGATSTTGLAAIGNNTDVGLTNRYFPGSVGHASLYNRALKPEEVEKNFNTLRVRYGI